MPEQPPGRTYWRPLGMTASIMGGLAIGYALAIGVMNRADPLIWTMVGLVVLPALGPAWLGYQMRRGHAWAAWVLRVWFLAVVVVGAWLQLVAGLDVFSFPPLAVPLLALLVGWLLLSFR